MELVLAEAVVVMDMAMEVVVAMAMVVTDMVMAGITDVAIHVIVQYMAVVSHLIPMVEVVAAADIIKNTRYIIYYFINNNIL